MTKKQNNISAIQIFLRASVVFTVFFILLFSIFALTAKFWPLKKASKPIVASDSVYRDTVLDASNSEDGYIGLSANPSLSSTSSPTPQTSQYKDIKPVLVSH